MGTAKAFQGGRETTRGSRGAPRAFQGKELPSCACMGAPTAFQGTGGHQGLAGVSPMLQGGGNQGKIHCAQGFFTFWKALQMVRGQSILKHLEKNLCKP